MEKKSKQIKPTTFDSNILLKLHRQYTENETIALQKKEIEELIEELKKSKFENGMLKSDLSEARDVLKEFEIQVKKDSEKIKNYQARLGDFDKELQRRLKEQNNKLKKFMESSRIYQEKYLSLVAKQNKNER